MVKDYWNDQMGKNPSEVGEEGYRALVQAVQKLNEFEGEEAAFEAINRVAAAKDPNEIAQEVIVEAGGAAMDNAVTAGASYALSALGVPVEADLSEKKPVATEINPTTTPGKGGILS
jgi:hypothetical protein